MNHGQKGLGQGGERVLPARVDLSIFLLVVHVLSPVLELRDVGARHEGLIAGPAQDDHADGVVGDQFLDVVGHELPRLEAHGISLLRPVEDDPADRSVLLEEEGRFLAHGCLQVMRGHVLRHMAVG